MITKAYLRALLKAATVPADDADILAERMLTQMRQDYGAASHNPLASPVSNNRRMRGH